MGNRIVLVPSTANPLAMTDFYSVLGNVRCARRRTQHRYRRLAGRTGAKLWQAMATLMPFGPSASPELSTKVEALSAGNLKRTFVDYGQPSTGFHLRQKARMVAKSV
jgi:aldehyde dehydrogenase (NAD+)